MTKKFLLCILFSFLFFQGITAQEKKDSLSLRFDFKFGNLPLELQKKYTTSSDTLEIDLLRFYISKVQINYTDGTSYQEKNSYHLIDIEDLKSCSIALDAFQEKKIEALTFTIGIDSTASVSGALSGALDPSKGMYWAWQSGYINMKIEGKSNSCPTRNNRFQFHVGGYLQPYCAWQTVELHPKGGGPILPIAVDLAELFSKIQLSTSNSIMIPGKRAVEMAELSTKMFQVE